MTTAAPEIRRTYCKTCYQNDCICEAHMDGTQPNVNDLVKAMALLVSENEQLRANQHNASPVYGRREFTFDDLERGRELAPRAFMTPSNTLVIRLDS
jgi:hypothetical protein